MWLLDNEPGQARRAFILGLWAPGLPNAQSLIAIIWTPSTAFWTAWDFNHRQNLLPGINSSMFLCKWWTLSFSFKVIWGKTASGRDLGWSGAGRPKAWPRHKGRGNWQDGRLHAYFNQDFYNTRPEGKRFLRGCTEECITLTHSWPCCISTTLKIQKD